MAIALGVKGIATPPLLRESQEFTSSGTFVVPDGVESVMVDMIGGGGAGGGGQNTAVTGNSGGGGGSGGVAYLFMPVAVTPGESITVTIGAGGAGVLGVNGGDGGNTIFKGIIAEGGLGGGIGGSANGAGGIAPGLTLYSNGNQQYEYWAMGPYKYPSAGGIAGFDDGGAAAAQKWYSPFLGYLGTENLVWTPGLNGNGGHGGQSVYGFGGIAGVDFEDGYAPLAGCYGAGGGGAGHLRTGLGGAATTGGAGADGYVLVRWA